MQFDDTGLACRQRLFDGGQQLGIAGHHRCDVSTSTPGPEQLEGHAVGMQDLAGALPRTIAGSGTALSRMARHSLSSGASDAARRGARGRVGGRWPGDAAGPGRPTSDPNTACRPDREAPVKKKKAVSNTASAGSSALARTQDGPRGATLRGTRAPASARNLILHPVHAIS